MIILLFCAQYGGMIFNMNPVNKHYSSLTIFAFYILWSLGSYNMLQKRMLGMMKSLRYGGLSILSNLCFIAEVS